MNHYVTLALTNRKSCVHLHALYSPPHCTKDVYTPQGSSPGLSTVVPLCDVAQRSLRAAQTYRQVATFSSLLIKVLVLPNFLQERAALKQNASLLSSRGSIPSSASGL
jgi:hypothetical protein